MTAELSRQAPRPAGNGRVVQINVSDGGVPKRPIERGRVGPLGLAGDGHRDRRHHGGPDRALCLLSLEVIGGCRRRVTRSRPERPVRT